MVLVSSPAIQGSRVAGLAELAWLAGLTCDELTTVTTMAYTGQRPAAAAEPCVPSVHSVSCILLGPFSQQTRTCLHASLRLSGTQRVASLAAGNKPYLECNTEYAITV